MSLSIVQLNKDNIPMHVALIMDGNRRWAKHNNKTLDFSYKKGVDNLFNIVRKSSSLGIKFITAYVFSVENFNRSYSEIKILFNLIRVKYLFNSYVKICSENNIKVILSGNIRGLNDLSIINQLKYLEQKTFNNNGVTLNLVINYGGRQEIVTAIKRILKEYRNSFDTLYEKVSADLISKYLYNADKLPDPDLCIRTGAEFRLSNFLPWQLCYSELFFSHYMWPDFDVNIYISALANYQSRDRRYGK